VVETYHISRLDRRKKSSQTSGFSGSNVAHQQYPPNTKWVRSGFCPVCRGSWWVHVGLNPLQVSPTHFQQSIHLVASRKRANRVFLRIIRKLSANFAAILRLRRSAKIVTSSPQATYRLFCASTFWRQIGRASCRETV